MSKRGPTKAAPEPAALNIAALYNDPTDSDISVALRGGLIYAHKIILRTCPGINDVLDGRPILFDYVTCGEHLYFDSDDTTTALFLRYIYGFCDSPAIAEWSELLQAAHWIGYPKLVDELITHIPPADFGQLWAAAQAADRAGARDSYNTICDAARVVLSKQHSTDPEGATAAFVNANIVDYPAFRTAWLLTQSPFILFMLDCAMYALGRTALAECIATIDFAAFDPVELDASIDHPALANEMAIIHLLSCIRTHARCMAPKWNTRRRRRGHKK